MVVAAEANGAPEVAWGDVFFLYDPENMMPPERHFPYATIVHNDYPGFDESSRLDQVGVYRVNRWVSRETFIRETADLDPNTTDYSVLDQVFPLRSTESSHG